MSANSDIHPIRSAIFFELEHLHSCAFITHALPSVANAYFFIFKQILGDIPVACCHQLLRLARVHRSHCDFFHASWNDSLFTFGFFPTVLDKVSSNPNAWQVPVSSSNDILYQTQNMTGRTVNHCNLVSWNL